MVSIKSTYLVLFIAVLTIFLFCGDGWARDRPVKEMLKDGVEHWYFKGRTESKPSFFKVLENVYNVVATDDNDELPFGKSVAFLVGVSEYENISPQLPFVKSDVERLRKFFLGKGGFDEVYVALDRSATQKLIENYMVNTFRKRMDKNDRLLFYYSGHGADLGGATGYIQFSKARRDDFANHVLPVKDCTEWSRMIKTKHILFIYDCCVSGLAFTGKYGRSDPFNEILQALSGNGSRTVITAGTGEEKTYGFEDRYSIFTNAFLNAFENPEGDVHGFMTMNQVFAHVEQEVKKFARRHDKTLTPRRWELEENKYRGTFLFINPKAKNEKLPKEYAKAMRITEMGQVVGTYGMIEIIAFTKGKIFIDGQYHALIEKGEAMEYTLTTGTHEIQLRSGDGVINKDVEIAKGELARVIIRPEKKLKEPGASIAVKEARKSDLKKSESPESEITNSLGMKFVYIKPGTFMMGSPENEPERGKDEVQHEVTLTKGYYMQTTEVTQGQWKAIIGSNPSEYKKCGDDCPVENVSWEDVQIFIKKLNKKEETDLYRLPTEAEWEYACRAGTNTPFSFCKCLSADQANYNGDYPLSGCEKGEDRGKTIPVMTFKPNANGLYDMHGNVWEWCRDWIGAYSDEHVTDPIGPNTGSDRVVRGGSWFIYAGFCRSAVRYGLAPGACDVGLGFRLLR